MKEQFATGLVDHTVCD